VTSTGNLAVGQAADYTYFDGGPNASDRFIVTTPKRRGTYALRVTVGGGLDRTECTANAITYAPGDEFWVATSLYFPTGFPIPSGGWMVLHQFFGETGGQSTGSPPFALEMSGSGAFTMTVRGGTKAGAGSAAPKDAGHYIADVVLNVWNDFLFHLRLAKDATGLVEAWHRQSTGSFPGTPNTTDTGVNVLTVAGIDQNVYPETGCYRSTNATAAVLYNNGMWIRATRAAAEGFFV
jgi:hypothetical protein